MLFSRSFRLPLATGSSPATLMMGLGLVGFLGSSPVFLGSLLPDWVALLCGLLIAAWFLTLLGLPLILKQRRASDLVLSRDGVEVEAGPSHGRRWTWAELGALRFEAAREGADATLRIGSEVLASSDEPGEIASLAALAETLGTLARGQHAEEPPWADLAPNVAHCATCGAPLVVTDDPDVRCRYCGARAELSHELASLVADAHTLSKSRERTLRAIDVLLRWPSARRVQPVLFAALVPLVFGWPAAGVFASEFFQFHDVLSWGDVGIVWVGTLAASLALVFWVEGQVVHRRAFALLVASFRARVLDAERGLLGCRQCGAPLGARADELVATCLYCRSESLLVGLDIPVHRHEAQSQSLQALAVERVRSIRTWRALGAVAVLTALMGVLLLAGPVTRAVRDHAPRHEPVDRPWSYEPPSR